MAIVVSMIAALTLFSVAATRDYMTWNRARWDLLQSVMSAGVPPERIDGGFEFNGLYSYDASYRPITGKSSWWVHDDQYLIAMGPVAGYEIVQRREYERWLPPQEGRFCFSAGRAPRSESRWEARRGPRARSRRGWELKGMRR